MDGFNLTTWQRRRLEDQLRHAESARLFRRTMAVLDASRGRPVAEIAKSLGVSRQCVYNWIESYRTCHNPEALFEGRHSGRPPRLDDEGKTILRSLLERRPDACGYLAVNWTAPLLKEQWEGATGKSISEDTIREELRRLGYVWKRGRYDLAPDPELEKKTSDPPSDRQFGASQCVVGRG